MNSKNLILNFLLLILLNLTACSEKVEQAQSPPIDQLIAYTQDRKDFSYQLDDSLPVEGATLYRIKMNSGKWLSDAEVNEPLWWHWVDIVVPDTIDTNTALLFIGPGSKEDTQQYLDSLSIQKAIETRSIISHVSNIPFQPLRFIGTDSIERYEDNLIAYGWDQFLTKGANDEDREWLARFPMTRAVVRAMDVVQEFTKSEPYAVSDFFISGASKRGWTTWTTAAVDSRVIGMAPVVIDLLNIVPSFEHHYRLYGDWSPAVQDYVDFNIMDWMRTPAFKKLLSYVEPYEFKERFKMPKLIINGTIDEFFATDSWKFYWDALPGNNYLQYVPNGNHGLLGSYQTPTIFSFYDRLIHSKALPKMEWEVKEGTFYLSTDPNIPYQINLWTCKNSKARDFRIWEVGRSWKKETIAVNSSGDYQIKASEGEGYTASLVEVVFYPESSNPLILSTGTVVLPEQYVFSSYQSDINLQN
ncbi:MAG: PhoPQ-activated protein PqaA family protein [Flavobacteriaceae bacterium]